MHKMIVEQRTDDGVLLACPECGRRVVMRTTSLTVLDRGDFFARMEADVSDILVVADWLLTGQADLALRFDAQTAANYRDQPVTPPDLTILPSGPHG